jgi:NAD(P)-dependent dehydrogenase (short-subunit alcohol dehydrogenase family)
MKRFENKVVLVTGGANGLGENLVQRLIDEGAKVAIADIEKDTMLEVCARYPQDKVFGVACDVRVKASVDEMVNKVVEHYGRIDILFNNAGIVRAGTFLECTEEDWRDVIDTNLTGAFFVAQAVARQMVRLKIKGVIVNTSSNTTVRATPKSGAYAPSKGGLRQLTRYMSLELAPYSIRVNEVAAGSVATRLTLATRNDKEKYARMLEKYLAGRFAEREEITSFMLFLASDDASWVHGDSYMVDSGFTIQ